MTLRLLLLFSILLLPYASPQESDPGAVTVEVASLKRSDLPNDFPFQALDTGFAVLRISIQNNGNQSWDFDPGQVTVFDPRRKTLDQASPEDITPKLMKFYRGGLKGIFGEASYGGRPRPGQWDQTPTIQPGRDAGSVSVDTARRLRAILLHYQIARLEIASGQSLEGLFYLKSKKKSGELSGGRLVLRDGLSVPIP